MTPTQRQPLTARQRECYEFIRSFLLEQHRPPTVRQLGIGIGVRSPNGVMCHMKALIKKVWLIPESQWLAGRYKLAGVKLVAQDDSEANDG